MNIAYLCREIAANNMAGANKLFIKFLLAQKNKYEKHSGSPWVRSKKFLINQKKVILPKPKILPSIY